MFMNKSVLILGGTGDIGQAITAKFVEDRISAVGHDLCDLDDKNSVEQFLDTNGPWDIIIHCAGYNNPKHLELDHIDNIEKNIRINVTGFLPIVQKNIDYWKTVKSGRLIIIGSLYSIFGRQGRLAYSASKHALLGITRTLSIELAKYNVAVNSVSPGYIMTKMTTKNNSADLICQLENNIPLRRLGQPQEVANLVYYLAKQADVYLTGQNIVIDGGYSAGGFQQ